MKTTEVFGLIACFGLVLFVVALASTLIGAATLFTVPVMHVVAPVAAITFLAMVFGMATAYD